MSPEPLLGIYVHVPFCSAICNYCNFNRGLFDESLKSRFVDALIQEISTARRAGPFGPAELLSADTLYFGGGTPSLLSSDDISRIIEAARQSCRLAPGAEITLEANPESVDQARLERFRRAGVNRLSFGVQSFRDDELRLLERLHTASRAEEAIGHARGAGFDNVSLDLMMWLPEQTAPQWMESVERAIALGPDHVSLYMLEVYPHLPLRQEMNRREWQQLPDDVAADMYEQAMARLESAGYAQYEISNVARPGRRSLHNLKYWSDGEWLGFGPGAHSTRRGSRWKNVASTEDYVQRLARGATVVAERRDLTSEERLGDALFTGLRLNDGVELSRLSGQYETDIWQVYGERLAPYCDAGLLLKEGDRIRLTRQGMLMAHEVMAVFV
jgi:oxygen-independent coproporphyrinogen-3 oxidase